MKLRRRLALALVGLTVASSGLLGLGYWLAEAWVERTSLVELLQNDLDRRIADQLPPDPSTETGTLRYFRPAMQAGLPSTLARLAPGSYESISVDGHRYRALVRDVAEGDRAYLLFDVSGVESRERALFLSLVGGVALIAFAAWRIAQHLARRTLAPLDRLVDEIGALNPASRGERLAVAGDTELQVIVEALNAYMQRLDAQIERERAFAAAAGHELRTPLAVIQNAVELLQATGTTARPLARIHRAALHARQDLEALLALARGRAAETETLSLAELLPQLAELHLLALGELAPQLEWDIAAPITLRCNPGELGIVFTNLLRNALRAAAQVTDGCVRVHLDQNGIRVADNGPGIAAEQLPQVFEPWLAGRDGGTGIGLYIARTVAGRAGWTLRLSNLEPHGVLGELSFGPAP